MSLHPVPDSAFDDLADEVVIVVALDGWTDAGRAGTLAAERLLEEYEVAHLATLDSDALYDYRDRRPSLEIDRGILGTPDFPELDLHHLRDGDTSLLLWTGPEPDLGWLALSREFVRIADVVGATRYIGLGAVPAPVPHTRPTRVITTASDELLLDGHRAQERIVVPASCQVVLEAAMRDAGLETLGLWARIPHYVGGEYPDAAVALLGRFADHVGVMTDATHLLTEADQNRERLDDAAEGSPEVAEHIRQLEMAYDADTADDAGISGPLPSGDEIAAEFERFLQDRPDG